DRRRPLPDGGRVQRARCRVGSRVSANTGQEGARRMADHRPQDLDHGRGPRGVLPDPLPDERRRRAQARGVEPDHRPGRGAGVQGRADRGHGRRAALQRGGHRRRVRPRRLAHRRGGHRVAAGDRRASAGTVRAGTVPVDGGGSPVAEAAMAKDLGTELEQLLVDELWHYRYEEIKPGPAANRFHEFLDINRLRSPVFTTAGGTNEVLRLLVRRQLPGWAGTRKAWALRSPLAAAAFDQAAA